MQVMNKRLYRGVVPRLIALLLGVAVSALAAVSDDREAEKLVFLLHHVEQDYGRAVREGRVVNPAEYDEVLALVGSARARYLESEGGGTGTKLGTGLGQLEAGIRDRAPAEQVNALIATVADAATEKGGGPASPKATPDPARGRELYLRDCAVCHGTTGAGDGRVAPGMNPSPGSLDDPATANALSLRHVRGAIEFGIEGTAMPSHEDAYAAGEAWDVAAFVLTLKEKVERRSDGDLDLDAARRLERTFTRVAERVLPSVVGISLFRRQAAVAQKGADHGPGWQRDGLDDLYPGYVRVRSRSGVLASDDGYVLTCGHLFEPSDAPPADTIIDIEVNGGQHFRAWIVGIEPTVDFAVLKVEAPIGLPPATLGDSDGVQTGRFAIAVGDPPGPELTFAVGTIAARAKEECYQDDRTSTLLQGSARIGAESFGGPLVDLDGRVLGITVPSGTDLPHGERYEGAAFALPIKLANTLFEALKIKQSTRSPWLGFAVRPLDWEQRRTMRAPQFGGIAIVNVFDPSPASRAGIRMGDLLMELDGNRINAVHDFQYWLYLSGIDKAVTLKLFRDGAFREVRTKIELRPLSAVPR